MDAEAMFSRIQMEIKIGSTLTLQKNENELKIEIVDFGFIKEYQ